MSKNIGVLNLTDWWNTSLSKPWAGYKKLFVANNIQIGHLYCLSPNYLRPERTGVKEVMLPTISVNPHAEILSYSLPLPHIPSSVKPSLTLLVYLMAPLPVPALFSATAALQSSGTAALSLFRVPRPNTASTWDMPNSLSIRALLLSEQGCKC